ncbi:GIY-YIG nuclease family protein [Sphingomonas profundi]|uniref:GIY-YIG nuclease family protein n=1 Tax=Alterirhizorhabdus profundi TaxID=2681549 RepID=UPI0012E8ABC4|nr:GIY-YIG nuclease family protein [Sphingomonas profundi]
MTNLFDAIAIRTALRDHHPFYVYVLCRPCGEPFYVGKGVKFRCLQHEADARTTTALTHKLNVIRSLHRQGQTVAYRVDSSFLSEAGALARERALIAEIGRHDLKLGPLTNQTDGGEGTSNPSEESRQRGRDSLWGEADDPERQIINRWFQKLTPVKSVPIKPVATFTRAAGLWKNDDTIGMKPRQAGAIVATALANDVMLEPGCLLPRRLEIEGVEYIIENGVGRDMVSNGMIEVHDATVTYETLKLTRLGYVFVVKTFGASTLIDAGVLAP